MHIIWPQLGLDGAFGILRDLKRLPASIQAGKLHVLRPVWFGVIIQSLGASSLISWRLCFLICKSEIVTGLEMALYLD